ncbi:MAG: restriction endonuclease subunit S [Bacteroidales bacterium]|nr:restriction endonuclease subunit S [Bacteroidales bacterium]
MTNINLNIPSHWENAKLGEIGEIASGGTPSTKIIEYFEGDIAWITPADLTKYNKKYIFRGKKNISISGLQKSSAKLLPIGSVLFSSRAPIGYVVIAANEISTNQGFKNLIPSKRVFNEYIYYYLKSAKRLAESLASGTTFKEISAKNFAKIPIPLPPLPEQHRIVAKIEKLFSELDNGIASLKKAKEQLKVYRQSVLKWAFEGRLTEDNIEDGILPSNWKMKKIDDICDVVRGGSPRPAGDPKYYNGNIPFLKVADLTKDNGKFLTSFTYTIKEAGLKKTRQINPNTLIISNSGATLGVPKICMLQATMNDGIAAFLNLDYRTNQYLYYFWQSKTLELRNINQGAAQPNLNTAILKNYIIPYCDFNEQERVVKKIESRFSVADNLEKTIDQSLQQAEALRQSILKTAFEGKLVPQDPDDEPAEVLLERIKK